MKNIAIFASGEGTNAQNIINYFKNDAQVKVALVVCNKPQANVLKRAQEAAIPTFLINRNNFIDSDEAVNVLKNAKIDLIVLAGFLWLIPTNLIKVYPNEIINIHPALLPKYGGKGMYGMNVHKAVIANQENESGISIHYVNENYDEGKIIDQYKCKVTAADSVATLALKIHELEQQFFPIIIEKILKSKSEG
ncbi:MAG: phosphoribosylglycinamide formyltransferase [Bacteroidia bacterium]